jgi:hypothetical protein
MTSLNQSFVVRFPSSNRRNIGLLMKSPCCLRVCHHFTFWTGLTKRCVNVMPLDDTSAITAWWTSEFVKRQRHELHVIWGPEIIAHRSPENMLLLWRFYCAREEQNNMAAVRKLPLLSVYLIIINEPFEPGIWYLAWRYIITHTNYIGLWSVTCGSTILQTQRWCEILRLSF